MFSFEGREISIDVLFNEEQLLDFALHYMTLQDNQDEVHPVAQDIIISYIIRQYQKEGREGFTEEEVAMDMSKLIADHVLAGLVKKGIVEVEFDENGEAIYTHVDLDFK